MSYRNANYCAFYVDEPVNEWNLGANAAHDLCYYRQLQAWKAALDRRAAERYGGGPQLTAAQAGSTDEAYLI